MLLPKSHLIRPVDYFVTAFDTNPFDKVNGLDTFTIVFKCGGCEAEIKTEPLMQKGKPLSKDPKLQGGDALEFAERCRVLTEESHMSLLQILEQACSACGGNHLLLFGHREWQPGRDIIEIGAIYFLSKFEY